MVVRKETICFYTEVEYTFDDDKLINKRLLRSWQNMYGTTPKKKTVKKQTEPQQLLAEQEEDLIL